MIRSVRGRLSGLDADGAVIDVGGNGAGLHVSPTTVAALPAVGEAVDLSAHLVVREDALDLYGFATTDERALFLALLGVSKVGPRLALAICGLDSPAGLRAALIRGDSKAIQAAPGVGKRTAERVVLELSDRLGAGNGASAPATPAPTGPFDDARAGLEGLGFSPEEAQEALAGAPSDLDSEALVRHALERLHRR